MSQDNPKVIEAKSTELVPVNPLTDKPRVWHSLDLNKEEERVLYLKAMGHSDQEADGFEGNQWLIRHVVCHATEITDGKSGEVRQAARTVMINPQGETLGTTSPYLWQALSNIISVYGSPPWDPPVKVKVVKRQSRNKMKFLSLDCQGR